jgi:hypothetical protein
MTFHAQGPPPTHDLLRLYEQLPEHVKADIDARYRTKTREGPTIPVFAFKFSPKEPDVPPRDEGTNYLSTEGCLRGCALTFVKARYFFEDLTSVEWKVIESPIFYMIQMIDSLDEAYELALSKSTVVPAGG